MSNKDPDAQSSLYKLKNYDNNHKNNNQKKNVKK